MSLIVVRTADDGMLFAEIPAVLDENVISKIDLPPGIVNSLLGCMALQDSVDEAQLRS
jgi:hypothetical protein